MIDEGNAEVLSRNPVGWFHAWGGRNEVSPGPDAAMSNPFQDVAKSLRPDAGVKEPPILKMFVRFQVQFHQANSIERIDHRFLWQVGRQRGFKSIDGSTNLMPIGRIWLIPLFSHHHARTLASSAMTAADKRMYGD